MLLYICWVSFVPSLQDKEPEGAKREVWMTELPVQVKAFGMYSFEIVITPSLYSTSAKGVILASSVLWPSLCTVHALWWLEGYFHRGKYLVYYLHVTAM